MEANRKEAELAWKRTTISAIKPSDLPPHTYIKQCSSSSSSKVPPVSDLEARQDTNCSPLSSEAGEPLAANQCDSLCNLVHGAVVRQVSNGGEADSVEKINDRQTIGGFKFDFDVDGL